MRKILTIAALLALLAIPMFAVGAAETCPDGGGWTKINSGDLSLYPVDGATQYCFKAGTELFRTIEDWRASEKDLSHWSYFFPEATPIPITTQVNCTGWRVWQGETKLDEGFWTLPFELEIAASNFYDGLIREPERCLQSTPTPEPITLENSCAGWRVKQGGETIEGAAWEDPFSLEVHFSEVLQQRIREPEECLKERGDVTLRIGGRCTEDGDSQEIGYVFDDGDFDGARLIITRQDGVEVANVGEGSDFFPARAADYSWQIIWFNGETREVLDEGEFSVAKCDLPEPTPTPKPPPEHPPTGGEMDAGLAVVTGLMGFALAGIGGSILFMKRRASR